MPFVTATSNGKIMNDLGPTGSSRCPGTVAVRTPPACARRWTGPSEAGPGPQLPERHRPGWELCSPRRHRRKVAGSPRRGGLESWQLRDQRTARPPPCGQSCGAPAGVPRSAPPHGEAGPRAWATGLASRARSHSGHQAGYTQPGSQPPYYMLVARQGFQLHILLKGTSLQGRRGPHP